MSRPATHPHLNHPVKKTLTLPLRRSLTTAAVSLLCFLMASPAWAHSQLVDSNPENGARLDAMPSSVTFTFNEEINSQFSQIVLVGNDGKPHPATDIQTKGEKVTAAIPQGLAGPSVKAKYRIVSADGHPVGGEVTFTVPATTSTPSAPAPAASSSATNPAPAPTDTNTPENASEGAKPWLIGAAAAAALLVGGAILLARHKRKQ
ncbi:Copper resistance protein CopC [Dermatophilus congolensis]|uniref:Copper resistance protein CopC n=2 Tax=Dermatophilus congolensis TaxID=1863 RepID=A0AA46BMG5_9MICO|nr:Copper resistance protein CopC [Dermatophilus congolensis]